MLSSKNPKPRKRKEFVCKICGKTFEARADKKGLYCSSKCAGVSFRKEPKACLVCGKDTHRGATMFCSNKCRGIYYRTRIEVACSVCGEIIIRHRSSIKKDIFCSRGCYAKHLSVSMTGDLHPRWNGGIYSPGGYVFVRTNGRYVQKHRQVVEEHMNRPLKSDEIIHHVNGIKNDNRIGNLQVVNRAEHLLIHDPHNWRSREKENHNC